MKRLVVINLERMFPMEASETPPVRSTAMMARLFAKMVTAVIKDFPFCIINVGRKVLEPESQLDAGNSFMLLSLSPIS